MGCILPGDRGFQCTDYYCRSKVTTCPMGGVPASIKYALLEHLPHGNMWLAACSNYGVHTYIHKDKVIASATRDRFPFMYFFHFHHQTCSRYFIPTPTILLFLSISSSYSPNPSSSQPCLCNVDPYSSQTPSYGRIQECYLLE